MRKMILCPQSEKSFGAWVGWIGQKVEGQRLGLLLCGPGRKNSERLYRDHPHHWSLRPQG